MQWGDGTTLSIARSVTTSRSGVLLTAGKILKAVTRAAKPILKGSTRRAHGFAERMLRNIGTVFGDQSGFAPENFTTFVHFSVSSAMNLPHSAGDIGIGSPPKSASRALIVGSARPALIALLSLSTISAGVFLGTPTPYQKLAS